MIPWLRENPALASVLAALIGVISTGAVAYHQLSNLIAGQPEVQSHIHDTTHHIDPTRDPQALKRLEDRIEKLERELDRRRGWQGGTWQHREFKR